MGLRLTLCLLLSLAVSAKPPAAAKKKAKAPPPVSVSATLLRMEREWSAAGLRHDVKTMDRILADDWISVDFHGKTVNKAQALAELTAGRSTSDAVELGEMKVKVLGATAIVTGSDTRGQYMWMDVFMKRDGRWQAVASQSAKVEK